MDQQWREKDGEVGTPAMEPDITNREEEADPVASNAMDEKGDSNPFGVVPFGRCCNENLGEAPKHWYMEC